MQWLTEYMNLIHMLSNNKTLIIQTIERLKSFYVTEIALKIMTIILKE
jgi:hypothetical protein